MSSYKGGAHGVRLHHFKNAEHTNGQGALTADTFEEMLLAIGLERILSAEEWQDRAWLNKLEPQHVCLTFDDNLKCQYDVALPILDKYKKTAFWFAYSSVFRGELELFELYRYFRTTQYNDVDEFYSDFFALAANHYPDRVPKIIREFPSSEYLRQFSYYSETDRLFRFLRDEFLGLASYNDLMIRLFEKTGFDVRLAAKRLWLDDEHLAELDRAGHVIGLHSYTHPTKITDLSAEDQESEYARNYEHLTGVLGKQIKAVAHPNGRYDDRTLAILNRLGVTTGFRADLDFLDNRSRLELPRKDHAILASELGIATC